MMLGYRDVFDYAECATCGSLYRLVEEIDLDRYYAAEKYRIATGVARPITVREKLK